MLQSTKPLLSVCCMTYNHEKYIAQAIESFVMQKVDFPIEIVIGEDCSPDGTRKIVQDYAHRYPSLIRPIFHEKNVGAINNFFSIIQQCNGEYIALCEGDDYWCDPSKLQVQVSEILKTGNCTLCFHAAQIIDAKDDSVLKLKRNANRDKFFTIEELIFGGGSLICTPSIIFKKEAFLHCSGEIAQYSAGDYALSLITGSRGKVLYLDRVLCAYRTNVVHSATTVLKKKSLAENLASRQSSIDMLRAFNEFTNRQYGNDITRKISQYLRVTIATHSSNRSYKMSQFKVHAASMTPSDRLLVFLSIALPFGLLFHKVLSLIMYHFYCVRHGVRIK